jgi:outer membrane protein OmpA-like peptidoglycan-associated protein
MLKKFAISAAFMAVACLLGSSAGAADTGKIEYLPKKPMTDAVTATKAPVKPGKWLVPVITWPGDTATIYTDKEGLFKADGLDVQLFLENDVVKQTEKVIKGETAFFRGTHGMFNQAAESFDKAGVEMVAIYNLTRSTGGDCMVVRPGIKSLKDLKGKTIVLQLYGPHVDLVTTILAQAGLKPTDVTLKFVKELSLPSTPTAKINDPRSAFAADTSIDACMVISPDAAGLTNNKKANDLDKAGKVAEANAERAKGGDGAEGSVTGAKILFSTKSADHIIYDQYWVRKDFFDANTKAVENFVHALMVGNEGFATLMADKANQAAKWNGLMSKAADLMFGSPQATGDVEGALGDCTWVGFDGNVQFYTAVNTTRTFKTLTDEVQAAFKDLGLMAGPVALKTAGWDYTSTVSKGLKNANVAAAPKPAFDPAKVQAKVETEIATEFDKWKNDEGILYSFEVYFKANQTAFTESEYKEAFKKALQISQTIGGSVIIIEGHNSPGAIERAQREGKAAAVIATLEQASKNVSYKRSVAVRNSFLEYCKNNNLPVDPSQFIAVGLGAKAPKFPNISTEEEWNKNEWANRRVVFKIKAVETELDSFKPAGK